jgi:hypothetical protein
LDPRWNLAHGIRSRGSGIHKGGRSTLVDTKTPKNGKRYAIITGNTDLTTESSKIQILKKIKDIKNIDGSLISVLLVTQTVSEGVDLKNIREVHILDPWWNMGGQIKS